MEREELNNTTTQSAAQEITRTNEQIAFFHGRKKRMINGDEWWSDIGDFDMFQWHPDDLNYHNSWDWLMPVVQKILSADIDGQDSYVLIIADTLKSADINKVYKSVCNFLEYRK